MTSTSRDEDSVSCTLDDGIALHTIVLIQPLPKLGIQVGALIMDGVVMRIQSSPFLYCYFIDHVSDLVCISKVKDVPQSTEHLATLQL